MAQISLAILTWKAPKTLQHTLQNLEPILDFFDEKIIVCQESDPDEIALAREFGFKAVVLETNVGIQNGMKLAFESCTKELVLFLENDLVLKTGREAAERILTAISTELAEGRAEFAKLRYLPESRKMNFRRYWRLANGRPQRRLLGYLRYGVANSMAADTLHFDISPGLASRHLVDLGGGVYQTSSRYSKWENLAVFARRSFFLDVLIPFAETHPTSRTVNGYPDLEHRINSKKNKSWWRDNNFKLLIAKPGLFGHRRLDRWAGDDKWLTADPADDGGPVERIDYPEGRKT
jgi:glycosyltransferase involved in cell wall biosynthesis